MSIFDRIKRTLLGDNEEEKSMPEDHVHQSASPQHSYSDALKAYREEKDHFFAHDPHSPLPPEEQEGFEGLKYYEPAPAMQYQLVLKRSEPELLTFQTSTGDEQQYNRIGTIDFEVEGEPATLAIYESVEHGDLFLPFRDATSGKETYGAGRYLEPIDLGDDQLLVDFNLAYNPFCAYSPDYSCPLPPIENWLKVPIRAGEKQYKEESFGEEDG